MVGSTALIVNHASALSGAELCLIDFADSFNTGSKAFLFTDGPLRAALTSRGIPVTVSRNANNFASIKRDQSLMKALPHVIGLGTLTGEVIKEARQHKMIYANSQKAFVVASIASAMTRRPLIWHLHDVLSPEHFGSGQKRLTVSLANRFARSVVVPSDVASQAFVAAGGKPSLVRVVPNGIDVPPGASKPSRESLGLPAGFLFGIFSRVAPWKGQHVGIRALSRIPGAHCVIAGGSFFGEDDYAKEIRDLAQDLGVADRVTFLGHRDDVMSLMRCVDVMVHPSVLPDSFGRTFVEAMLSRIPVIAGDLGAAPEILENGRCGFLIPPNDPDALAKALSTVRDQDTTQMIDRAEQRALARYTVKQMVAGVRQVIQSVEG
jgi:glycosyltransferase involved in cell wall biosynthesis